MASTRITCPDCKSVLKPAKPVPDGKKVKCPKCGNLFTTPGLVEDEEGPPRKKASGKKEKAAIKKAPPSQAPAGKPAYNEEDEETDGGIYGYISDDKEEKEEEDKPEINYAPDMSIKDLRGPAQELLVKPSNYMILIGGLCCLCDILLICICFWPMVFSEHVIDHEDFLNQYAKEKGTKEAAERAKNPPKERKDLKADEEEALEDATRAQVITRFIILSIYVLLLIYNGITIIGAVKMQNMESRGWGIASSIMTILPFGSSGLSGLLWLVLFILFAMLLDDPAMGMLYASGVSSLVWLLAIVVGVWSLRTLMSQTVIDGFEYVAD